jgi:hypothetical protein
MRQVGIEPTTFGFEVRDAHDVTSSPRKGLRKSQSPLTARGQRAASNDPGLTAVIEAWDRLPEALRAGIVAMVKTTSKEAT